MAKPSHHPVIVVGAGISGLSAGKLLKESGIDVLVLEARGRVGGRTWTRRDVPVNYIDMGGSYVGPTQDYVLRMAKELGVETYLINEKEDLVFYDHGKRIRWNGSSLPSTWNPLAYMDMNNFFRLVDKLGEEIPNDKPWEAPHAHEWDRKTFQQFMDENLHTRMGHSMAHLFTSLLVASEPYENSMLFFLWYVKQCGGSLRIFSTTNGGQERKFKGGSQLLSDKMAERLKGIVQFEKAVRAITQNGDTVTVDTEDGTTYTTQHVILAMSPAMQVRIHFEPSLPPLRNQLIQRMPMGSVIKCSLFYDRPFWKDLGFCGSLLIEGGENHPVIYALDDTKPDGSYPAITGFITGDKCRQIITKTKEERKRILTESFAEVLGSKEALQVTHYEEHSWMSEVFSGGCYTGTCPPGLLSQYGKVLRDPIGRLYFAGTETATQWSGYMDGAISSGERAAREVLCAMGKLHPSQVWQKEPKSKEVPGFDFQTSFVERCLPSVPAFLGFLKASVFVGTMAALFTIHRHRFL